MKLKLIKSPIGCLPKQRKNLQALGLRRIGQVRDLPDDGAIQGKIDKVKHLLEVIST